MGEKSKSQVPRILSYIYVYFQDLGPPNQVLLETAAHTPQEVPRGLDNPNERPHN